MNDKTFWTILGVILVGWLALFFLLIFNGKMAVYSQTTSELEKSVSKMKTYAKKSLEELPTEDLLETRQTELQRQERALAAAQEFFTSREEKLSRELPPTPARWGALYLDAFQELKARYGEIEGTRNDEGEILFDVTPFEAQSITGDELAWADRLWRTEAWLLDQVISRGGKVVEMDGRVKKTDSGRRGRETSEDHEYFSRQSVSATVKVPPSAIGEILGGILEHDDLILEVASFEVEKDTDALVYSFVLPEDQKIEEEPHVVLTLSVDVLMFHPKPDASEED
ncbi:MAG: hypothetical protein ACO4BJ_10315 [Planctomycetota bacterium]|jgi:hypothetical protein